MSFQLAGCARRTANDTFRDRTKSHTYLIDMEGFIVALPS